MVSTPYLSLFRLPKKIYFNKSKTHKNSKKKAGFLTDSDITILTSSCSRGEGSSPGLPWSWRVLVGKTQHVTQSKTSQTTRFSMSFLWSLRFSKIFSSSLWNIFKKFQECCYWIIFKNQGYLVQINSGKNIQGRPPHTHKWRWWPTSRRPEETARTVGCRWFWGSRSLRLGWLDGFVYIA